MICLGFGGSEPSLRGLASAGGGRFAKLSTDDRDLEYLLSGATGTSQAGNENLATDHWREEGSPDRFGNIGPPAAPPPCPGRTI